MKLISFVIPCFNSQAYMHQAIASVLKGRKDVEIIIVNDGSNDNTLKIAREYQKTYPEIVKVIDKENGGHGSAINAGLKVAEGKYFKVVDSDDWVDRDSLKKVIAKLKKIDVDMMIVDYVYEKDDNPKIMKYPNLPQDKIFTWCDIKKFGISSYLLMHSVIYKTSLLKEINLKLPEHTFYVDNIFVYYPLSSVKTMYYLDVPFYRYFIGRSDQSVNERVMLSRIDQQIFVTKTMIDFFDPRSVENKKLSKYLIHYLDIMMSVSTILLKLDNTLENKAKIRDLWQFLDEKLPKLKRHLIVANMTRLPRFISVPIYKVVRKVFKFN